jgi:mRNA interferase HigB
VLFRSYCKTNLDCASQVITWIAEAKNAKWTTPQDIKNRYVHASFLADNRVVFNIKGNRYRLDIKVYYDRQEVLIKRIGTHEEYNKWRF